MILRDNDEFKRDHPEKSGRRVYQNYDKGFHFFQKNFKCKILYVLYRILDNDIIIGVIMISF